MNTSADQSIGIEETKKQRHLRDFPARTRSRPVFCRRIFPPICCLEKTHTRSITPAAWLHGVRERACYLYYMAYPFDARLGHGKGACTTVEPAERGTEQRKRRWLHRRILLPSLWRNGTRVANARTLSPHSWKSFAVTVHAARVQVQARVVQAGCRSLQKQT